MYNITADETQPRVWDHLNGTTNEVLDRFQVSELCKGWPVYRDASEWNNFRDIFADEGAFVFTTWSGGLSIEDFIQVSKEGRAKGDFIMHRELGTLVDLNPDNGRAIGKMKTTITQRFQLDGVEFDIDCDNRFIFFCRKDTTKSSPEVPVWKVQYYKVFYEKDKVVAVDGKTVPDFTPEELGKYPEGYKHLGAAQAKLGHKILTDLPTMNNGGFTKLREAMDLWLRGEETADTLGVPPSTQPRF